MLELLFRVFAGLLLVWTTVFLIVKGGRYLGELLSCIHQYGPWEVVERRESLFGPLGSTSGVYYYNQRVCVKCGFTQMMSTSKHG